MFSYYFSIADLDIRIESPEPITFQQCMKPFQKKQQKKTDLFYKIIGEQKRIDDELIIKREYFVFKQNNQYVRVKKIYTNDQEQQTFLYKRDLGMYDLYIPVKWLEEKNLFVRENVVDFLALEDAILPYQAFLLHSSFISWQEKGILFTAPSGTGKSTQADLWHQYEGAEIYNGDRTIVRKIDGIYHGFGSPYAGSSGIYRNETAPVRAIVVLTQAPENHIEQLTGKNAFVPLYRETLMNTWNPAYMEKMTDLLMDAAANIPVYHLACRPDRGAVDLVKKTLFQKEA